MKNYSTRWTAVAQGAKAALLVFGLASLCSSMMMAQSSGALSPRRTSGNGSSKAIFITAEYKPEKSYGYISYAAVYQEPQASNDYVLGEDAEVLLLDASMMRFAVFTAADDYALSVNQMRDEKIIPIGFIALKKTTSEVLRFQGNDAYLREWVLVSDLDEAEYPLYDDFSIEVSMPQDGTTAYHLEHRFAPEETVIDLPQDTAETMIPETEVQDTLPSLPLIDEEITVVEDSVPVEMPVDSTLARSQPQNSRSDSTNLTVNTEDTLDNYGAIDEPEVADVPTALPSVDESALSVSACGGELVLRAEKPLGSVYAFSAAGQLVACTQTTDTSLSLFLPTGTYVLRVEGLSLSVKAQVR